MELLQNEHVIAMILAAIAWIFKRLESKIKQEEEKYKEDRLKSSAFRIVGALMQTTKRELAEDLADGKITPEERKKSLKALGGTAVDQILREINGLTREQAETAVESAVMQHKTMGKIAVNPSSRAV